ncbi:MAG TPA: cysteine desulfurase family protein [Candidatus Saccharimonadales bacterium]|nr:cysteine desulfurase family protein [Candidatus Saccharimonadales bacterium]
MKSIYLDYAAATPMDAEVFNVMRPYFTQKFYNPSATYLNAKQVRADLEQARADVAGLLGVKPAEVVFMAGATEANNLAIQGIMRQFPDERLLVSAIEHDSVLEPAGLFNHIEVPVTSNGRINLNILQQGLQKAVLVSVGLINNEIGVIQPLREIASLVDEERRRRRNNGIKKPLWLHTDAAQAPNYLDIHASRLGVDLMSINGGKIYGPKQIGVLYVRAGVDPQALILGGGQEFNLRSGTENVAYCAGLAKALNLAQDRREAEAKHVKGIKKFFIDELHNQAKDFFINGSIKFSSPHILSVTFTGQDNERLMIQLDEAGVQVATGSACSATDDNPSHVLKAIGLTDQQARSTLRFSFGYQTTITDIKTVVRLLSKMLT